MEIIRKEETNDDRIYRIFSASKLPTLIVGYGDIGKRAGKYLRRAGVQDVRYCTCFEKMGGYSINPISGEIPSAYNLICGFQEMYTWPENIIRRIFAGAEHIGYLSEIVTHIDLMDYGFYEQNEETFLTLYEDLKDAKSKDTLEAFINAKINKDASFFWDYVEPVQYFTDFICKNENEVFVDCGAFDGDTISAFLQWSRHSYKRIVAFEADGKTMKRLLQNTKDYENIEYIPYAAYSEKTVLKFSEDEYWGIKLDPDGSIALKAESIDNLELDDVSFIAMDIEGSEQAALKGATETIKRCHPVLALSAYHKRDDIIKLYQTIASISNDYCFYFRVHKFINTDAVLYAVPKSRVC